LFCWLLLNVCHLAKLSSTSLQELLFSATTDDRPAASATTIANQWVEWNQKYRSRNHRDQHGQEGQNLQYHYCDNQKRDRHRNHEQDVKYRMFPYKRSFIPGAHAAINLVGKPAKTLLHTRQILESHNGAFLDWHSDWRSKWHILVCTLNAASGVSAVRAHKYFHLSSG